MSDGTESYSREEKEKEEDEDGDIAGDVPLDSTLYVPWVRWVLCVLGGTLLAVVSVTALLYREPGDSLPAFEQLSPLELGAEECSKERLRATYAAVLERILYVFGPADIALLSTRGNCRVWHVGEEQVLFEVVREALRKHALSPHARQALEEAFRDKKCDGHHLDLVQQSVAPFAEAISRVLHIRSLYGEVSSGAVVDRMCRHAKALQNVLPPRLLIAVDTAARSYGVVSTAVLFYELHRTRLPHSLLTERLQAVFRKHWCSS
jgi:hypothetical protein